MNSSFFGIISLFLVTNNYPANSVHINMKKEKKKTCLIQLKQASMTISMMDILQMDSRKKKLFLFLLLNIIYAPNRPPPPSLGFPIISFCRLLKHWNLPLLGINLIPCGMGPGPASWACGSCNCLWSSLGRVPCLGSAVAILKFLVIFEQEPCIYILLESHTSYSWF